MPLSSANLPLWLARHRPSSESSRGFNDIIGVVLMGFAVLLLVALFSYHPRDVSANILPTNASVA